MKHMIILAAALSVAFAGCKSIEVDRRGQALALDQNGNVVKTADGNPLVLDQGWEVDYFQHWNWQRFDSLSAKAGAAELSINNYASGADSNLTALVSASLKGATELIATAAEAYVKIAGGGAQASTALDVGQKIYEYFAGKGGDASKATVSTTADNKVQVSDGTTCVTCDKDGNCTDCSVAATTTN